MATEQADIPPIPKVTATAFAVCATALLFGLGMAVGGHELHKIGLQPGIVLIVCSVVLVVFTGLIHITYCYGWNQRGKNTVAPAVPAALPTNLVEDVRPRFVVDGTRYANGSGAAARPGSPSPERSPSLVTVVRLAKGMGVDPGMLVKGLRT